MQRRTIAPNIAKGVYPFTGIKLCRADIEWLLATHENGRGPIDWNDEEQRERNGLDLRGADLRHEDLSGLPLARLHGGLILAEWLDTIEEQPGVVISPMEDARLKRAQLQKVNLYETQLQGANLSRAQLQDANLSEAQLQDANLSGAQLQGVHLEKAQLQQANLSRAQLQKSYLYGAQLQGANLCEAQLQGAVLSEAELEGVHLNEAILSDEQYGTVLLADVKWGEINLAVVDWTSIKVLGDEQLASQRKHIDDYRTAVRANRQLAVTLQGQGLNEEAAHFAYRAQVLQKSVLWHQMTQQGANFRQRMQALGGWLFSWFLFLLAGYGYKPMRSVVAYLVIIFGFMGLYLLNAHFITPHLTWDEALVLSVSSFHGRGFFTQQVTLGDTYARLAAIQAVVGLFIEISFIATFTQRFFGR